MNLLGEAATGVGLGLALVATALLLARSLNIEDAIEQKGTPKTDGGYVSGFPAGYGKPTGVIRWLTTVDHKDIGLLYLLFGSVAFFWGGMDAMMIRTELFTPNVDVWNATTYNGLFTMHGLTMLFFFATPVLFGFANYFLPLLIGADDMAFPRINAIAFWLLPAAFLLVRFGLISDIFGHVIQPVLGSAAAQPFFTLEPPTTGWTMYTPLSRQQSNPMINVMLLGLHLSGLSTTMGAVNIIVTTFTLKDVEWAELDIFSWTLLTQAGLVLFAFPLLGSAILMLLFDRVFGTTFFALNGGGPLLWQNLFWFFGHPEVYILVLPPMGLISLIIPRFTGRRLFGFKFVVYSTLAIGVLSFGVWAHHMFTTGMDPRLRASFMAVSLAIAVPSAVKVFNWISTMWNGNIRLTAPMLFCVGVDCDVHHRRRDGRVPRVDSGGPRAPRHLLRRRSLPPHHHGADSVRHVRGGVLLVPHLHGPNVQQVPREGPLLAHLHRRHADVQHVHRPRHGGPAAALRELPAAVRVPPTSRHRGRVHHRYSARWSGCGTCSSPTGTDLSSPTRTCGT